jgi:hypothetical protein
MMAAALAAITFIVTAGHAIFMLPSFREEERLLLDPDLAARIPR